MANFKPSVERVSGAKIIENGVERDIIFLEPLVRVGETKTACYSVSEVAALVTTLANSTDFSGYHIATSAELRALCNLLTEQYEGASFLAVGVPPRAVIGWKLKEEIPGNITGPEYVRQVLGWLMDGYEVYDPETDTVSRKAEGTCCGFWTGDTINSAIKRPFICTDDGAMYLQMLWGLPASCAKRSILMVKNRD